MAYSSLPPAAQTILYHSLYSHVLHCLCSHGWAVWRSWHGHRAGHVLRVKRRGPLDGTLCVGSLDDHQGVVVDCACMTGASGACMTACQTPVLQSTGVHSQPQCGPCSKPIVCRCPSCCFTGCVVLWRATVGPRHLLFTRVGCPLGPSFARRAPPLADPHATASNVFPFAVQHVAFCSIVPTA